jgi:hypothetical protein
VSARLQDRSQNVSALASREEQTTEYVAHNTGAPEVPQSSFPMIQGGAVVSAIFGIAHVLLWLKRRMSHDRMESKADESVSRLIHTLQAERDRAMSAAREAWDTKSSDSRLIGELSTKVLHLAAENGELRMQMDALRMEVGQLRKTLRQLAILTDALDEAPEIETDSYRLYPVRVEKRSQDES